MRDSIKIMPRLRVPEPRAPVSYGAQVSVPTFAVAHVLISRQAACAYVPCSYDSGGKVKRTGAGGAQSAITVTSNWLAVAF